MKNFLSFIFLTFLLVACNAKQAGSSATASTHEDKQQAEQIAALAQKHSAITNWAESLPRRDGLGTPFSSDMSRALLRNVPVLTEAYLEDISEKDGKFTGFFDAAPNRHGPSIFQLTMVLQLNGEQAEKLLHKAPTNDIGKFALIVRFSDVRRPTTVVPAPDAQPDNPDFKIEVPTSGFMATGTCVDFLQLQ